MKLYPYLAILIMIFQSGASPMPSEIFSDNFDNDLAQWTVAVTSPSTVTLQAAIAQSAQALRITNSSGGSAVLERQFATPARHITIWFYDNGSAGGWFVSGYAEDVSKYILLGLNTNSSNQYYYRIGTQSVVSFVNRSTGWHKLELIATPHGAYGRLDDRNLSYLPNGVADITEFHRMKIISTWGITTNVYFDNLVVEDELEPGKEKFDIFLETYADKTYTTGVTCGGSCQKDRLIADAALSYAVRWIRDGNTDDLSRAVAIIKEQVNPETTAFLQDHYSTVGAGSLARYSIGLSAWLVWDNLSPFTQQSVKIEITRYANWISTRDPLSSYIVNTSGEANAWMSNILTLAGEMFPNEPNSAAWRAQALSYSYHSLTVESDAPYSGIDTTNLWSNYLLDNHNYHPHPGYAFYVIGALGNNAMIYERTGQTPPTEFSHNVQAVMDAHLAYVTDKWQYQNIFSNGKDDWGTDATSKAQAFAYMAHLDGNYQPIYDDLLSYHNYIQPDYAIFPRGTDTDWFLNAVNSARSAGTWLLNSDIMLEPR